MNRKPQTPDPQIYTPSQHAALVQTASQATTTHLLQAADYISRLFSANEIPHALMGGLSLRIRGSNRNTTDVDVAVGCSMQRLLEVLREQDCIRRPAGPTAGVMRVFVKTGSANEMMVRPLEIIVDLIMQGLLGAPLDPHAESEIITYNTSQGPRQYRVLSIPAISKAKLGAYFTRGAATDMQDLVFLLSRYPTEMFADRALFDMEHRVCFVNAYARDNAGATNLIRKMKHLLGVA